MTFKFGTSGIRDLTTNLLQQHVAKELAQKLSQMGWTELSLGRDGRIGSDQLMTEFISNFSGTIKNFGITTTPEIAAQPGLAVMITASHNPCEYCGFKIYLNHREQNTADLAPVPIYNKWNLLPRDIIIDCANGGLGDKLKKLGFTNIINDYGEINQNCGATHPENLANYCKEHHQEIGFAVDGDADRFIMYLGERILASEEVAFLLAKLAKIECIVIDETVNSALTRHFKTVRCKVGGHAVTTAMYEKNIDLGAEKSGHYYFDKNSGSSDALDAIILMANGYHQYGLKGLLELLSAYKPDYQFNINIKIADLPKNYESILADLNLSTQVRKVIRKSGTEPLLRIMLEGRTKSVVDQEFAKLKFALKIK